MSAVAIIPARGGSKRIPRKNGRLFHGRPILYYSIKAAQDSGLFSAVVVSTEDDRIGRIAEGYGATWYPRSVDLAEIGEPDCGTQTVAADVILWLHANGEPYTHACCIYPCAPLLTPDTLRVGFEWVKNGGFNYVFTKGWFYWGRAQTFIDTPDDFRNSMELQIHANAIDINEEADWQLAEKLYAELHP